MEYDERLGNWRYKKMATTKHIIWVTGLLAICYLIIHPAYAFAQSTWAHAYGGSNDDSGSSIEQTSDGGYIVAGSTWSIGVGNSDIWILKLDSTGNVVWQKTYGGSDNEYGSSIEQTSDGDYIVLATIWSIGAGADDIWILKLDSIGNVVWQKIYSGSIDVNASSIQQTSDGGYIVAGSYLYDMLVLKLDVPGNITWQKTYGALNNDSSLSIQQTSDGGYIMAGYTKSFGEGNYDIWILKLKPNGTMGSSCSFNNNTAINAINSSATTANTNASISSPSITIINTGIAGIDSMMTDILICSSCPVPDGLTNNTATDEEVCVNAGIHVNWNVDPENWRDGGMGHVCMM
jgi:hypothetical protein